MAERALIIAIEVYKDAAAGFTAKVLKGTLDSALRFRDWLEEKWKAEGNTGTILFCSEPKIPGGSGATSAEIIDALIRLEAEGRNTTDNLYVYFSGHGFRAAGEKAKLADVLVSSDFKDTKRSVASCFSLDALTAGLRSSLGHGCHYHFIDACRNEVPKAIASNIMPFSGLGSEEPSVFVLQSTVSGAPALVGGPFAESLVEGLRGAGTAKVWEPPAKSYMKVRFDTLWTYLKARLKDIQPITHSTSGEIGESEAVLATIKPVPQMKLSITIKTVLAKIQGKVTVTRYGAKAGTDYPINGKNFVQTFEPYYYTVALDMGSLEVSPAGEIEVELYEDRELTFQVSERTDRGGETDTSFGLAPVSFKPLGLKNVHVEVPRGAEILLRHLGTGRKNTFRTSKHTLLPMGDYNCELRIPGGSVLRRRQLRVESDKDMAIAPAQWQDSLPHESIAKMLPHDQNGVDFSASLGGPVKDPDLGVWLAILGGARILGARGDYSKIAPLPLVDFSSEAHGASPVYVLAGLPDSKLDLFVGLSDGRGKPEWLRSREPEGMQGLREAVMHPRSGQRFVTLALGNQPAYTLASFASPNHCTLIVLTLDEEGAPRVEQYILPVGHLLGGVNPVVRRKVESRNQLDDVRTLAQLSRAFRKRRRLAAGEFSKKTVDDLLDAKWLDPIGASLAAYECMRRGQSKLLPEVAANMKRFFPDLPDTAAIVRLAQVGKLRPLGVPLFLDGLRAFPKYQQWLPFPAGRLDFSGPWTAWRSVVSVNNAAKIVTYSPNAKPPRIKRPNRA